MVSGIANNNRQLLIEQPVISQQSVAHEKIIDKVKIAPNDIDRFDKSKPALQPMVKQPAILPDALSTNSKVNLAGGAAAASEIYDVAVVKDAEYVEPGDIKSEADFKNFVKQLSLDKTQQKAAIAAYGAVAKNPEAKKVFIDFLQDTLFTALSSAGRSNFLAMVQYYPEPMAITNMLSITQFDWFADMDKADQQRSMRLVGSFSKNAFDFSTITTQSSLQLYAMGAIINGDINLKFSDSSQFVQHDSATNTITIGRTHVSGGDKATANEFALECLESSIADAIFVMDMVSDDEARMLQAYSGRTILDYILHHPDFANVSNDEITFFMENIGFLVENNNFASPCSLLGDSNYQKLLPSTRAYVLNLFSRPGLSEDELSEIKGQLGNFVKLNLSELDQNYTAIGAIYVAIQLESNQLRDVPDADLQKAGLEIIKALLNGQIKVEVQEGIVAGNPVTIGIDVVTQMAQDPEAVMNVYAALTQKVTTKQLSAEAEAFSKLAEYKKLNTAQQRLCLNALEASADKKALSKSLSKLLKNKDFTAADNSTKEAVLAQCANFPVALAADKLTEMVKIGWFKDMDLADQQRAAKSIAYMSETAAQAPAGSDQKKILTNTMGRLLNGSIPLAFVPMDDDPGYITFGYAINGEAGIYINIDLVPAGNDPFPKDDDYARQAILDTIPHEVSHQVNKDVNEATYKYFQAEYRAWYVGWVANNGTVPTNQDAYDRAIELLSIYDSLNEAYFEGGTHTTKILDFISQMVGTKLKAASSSEEDLCVAVDVAIKNPNAAAPVPDPSLKPDMDN